MKIFKGLDKISIFAIVLAIIFLGIYIVYAKSKIVSNQKWMLYQKVEWKAKDK